jgi:hypothetical protein
VAVVAVVLVGVGGDGDSKYGNSFAVFVAVVSVVVQRAKKTQGTWIPPTAIELLSYSTLRNRAIDLYYYKKTELLTYTIIRNRAIDLYNYTKPSY